MAAQWLKCVSVSRGVSSERFLVLQASKLLEDVVLNSLTAGHSLKKPSFSVNLQFNIDRFQQKHLILAQKRKKTFSAEQ